MSSVSRHVRSHDLVGHRSDDNTLLGRHPGDHSRRPEVGGEVPPFPETRHVHGSEPYTLYCRTSLWTGTLVFPPTLLPCHGSANKRFQGLNSSGSDSPSVSGRESLGVSRDYSRPRPSFLCAHLVWTTWDVSRSFRSRLLKSCRPGVPDTTLAPFTDRDPNSPTITSPLRYGNYYRPLDRGQEVHTYGPKKGSWTKCPTLRSQVESVIRGTVVPDPSIIFSESS